MNTFRAFLALLLLTSSALAQSQAPIPVPTTGPMSATTFTTNYLNPSLLSLGSCSWGPSAPANGPGGTPLLFQCWVDTSLAPVAFKRWDGSAWATQGRLDTSTHQWSFNNVTINPPPNSVSQGLAITQTAPSSGVLTGQVIFNRIDVTNPGLSTNGVGFDAFGAQSLIYAQRNTMSVTGPTTGGGSSAFGAFTNISGASDGFGGSHGVTITGASPAGHNAWGSIAYGLVWSGGQIGLLIGIESEIGVAAGGIVGYRIGLSANSQAPVQGIVMDAAFAASTISNQLPGGGSTAPFQHLMALGNYYGNGFPIATSGDFFFSEVAGTVANFANLSNVTVTSNIMNFPNMQIAGNGGAAFGIGGGSPLAGQLFVLCPSCGSNLIFSMANGAAGFDGLLTKDVSTNNSLFSGVAEASNTSTRFDQAMANYAQMASSGTTNAGLAIGTVTNVPFILGTNNHNRIEIFGSGCVGIGSTFDCGAPGSISITGVNTAITQQSTLNGASNFALIQSLNSTAAVDVAMIANEPSRSTVRWGLSSVGNWAEIGNFGTGSNGLAIGTTDTKPMILGTGGLAWMTFGGSGGVTTSTSFLMTGSSAFLGYTTGAGGAVTQTTSRTTSVTLNRPSGAITLVSAAGTTTIQAFTINNSLVAATDTIVLSQKSGTDKYTLRLTNVASGSFEISYSTTGGTTTEQPVFNFDILKGSNT